MTRLLIEGVNIHTGKLRHMKGVSTGDLSENATEGRRFVRSTPPGTWVWENDTKQKFGKTKNKEKVYVNPNSSQVSVTLINNKGLKLTEGWDIKSVINMTAFEKFLVIIEISR